MTFGRTLLLGVASVVIATAVAPVTASAEWREPRGAFARLACWYSGTPFVKGPGPTFGYGYPSCWGDVPVRRHHRRALHVRG